MHAEDPSELRARLAAAEARAERYRAIVDDLTELVCRCRPDGTVTFVNAAYCRYFARRREELEGRGWRPHVAEQDAARYAGHLATLNPASPIATTELRVVLADGEVRWHQWIDRALFDTAGELVEIQSVGRDITEHVRTEEKRRQIEAQIQHARDLESLGRFASDVAHDFNNLLVGILGNAGLALMDLSPFSPCRPLIQEVERAAHRAAELSNEMLVHSGRAIASSFPPASPAEEPQVDEPWRGEGTVLVVDDEEVVRTLARRILEKFGFKVMTAEDGRRALEIFRAHAKDLAAVLLDVTMPNLSGEETFREMQRIRPEARVILTSGYNEQEATRRFASAELAGFIQKPYLPHELIDKVREVIES